MNMNTCRFCTLIFRCKVQQTRLCRLYATQCQSKADINRRLLQQGDRQPMRRNCSSEVIPPPPLDGEIRYPEKIHNIVEQISSLTVAEVADLNKLLKQTLGIQDAPLMAVGAQALSPAQEKDDDDDGEVVVAPKEKTQFTVKLTKFDETSKVKLIKQIKALMSGMNLVQAKKFVESAPQVVKADVGKTEAEEIVKQIEEAGGSCEIE